MRTFSALTDAQLDAAIERYDANLRATERQPYRLGGHRASRRERGLSHLTREYLDMCAERRRRRNPCDEDHAAEGIGWLW